MISVLLPTRGRVPVLHTMLTTLFTTVSDRRNVEVIARCDTDDQPTIDYLANTAGVKVICKERIGYAMNARMVNECAVEAMGHLLLVANDDLEFQTTSWDRKLEAVAAGYPDGIFALAVDTVLNNENLCFPCISRRTMRVLGCFFDERLLYPDIWIRDIMLAFGRVVRVPEVVIKHNWAGQSEDQIRAGQQVHGNAAYTALYDRCLIEGRGKIRRALAEAL
jgi:hypothetical protein